MKRSKFSLSHSKLFSCNMGNLIPCGLIEALPGDSVQQATSLLLRCSPLMAPVMHPVNVSIHHWFVPHRLVWDTWERFITGGPDGNDDTTVPQKIIEEPGTGSLADYFGISPDVSGLSVSALPFRAYALIYNEWYRDQDLQLPVNIDTGDGPDTATNTALLRGCWEKDYFTSARPWEQKGPSITIPLGDRATVMGIGVMNNAAETHAAETVRQSDGSSTAGITRSWRSTEPTGRHFILPDADFSHPDIYADLSNASAININILRESFALQRFEEARARYGSRYVEYLRYLGVRSSDARLQRPEYLGGGRQTIQFSEVLQTAEGTDPVGELRGHGIAAMRSNRYRRFFEEHGYIISIMVVRPKTIYMDSLNRTWTREVKTDFFQKELQHIGQQEVKNKEVYAKHATPEGVFGFQDRYDEYRRQESSVAGEFRTSVLNHWHFGRDFATDPALNDEFVECVPTERTFAVPSMDVLYVMCKHSVQARRIVAQSGASFIY